MKSSKFLAALFALGAFAGCSSDETEVTPVGPETSKESVFMSVQVAMPTARGVRSTTDKDTSEEVGQDVENNVSTVLMVLATVRDEYVAHSVVGGLTTKNGSARVPKAKIARTDIQKFYTMNADNSEGTAKDDATIRVYIFCNPTQELLASIGSGSDWTDAVCGVSQGNGSDKNLTIWADNSFLMSNASIAERRIPANFSSWVADYSEDKPFDLSGTNDGKVDNQAAGGAIKVERSVARFDFRDGSQGDSTYDIGMTAGEPDGSLKVQLLRMALVNMSNEFYYLRRVSADGMPSAETLCGTETVDNYVVDTDAAFKHTADLTKAENLALLKNHFNYPLFTTEGKIDGNARTQWDSYRIADVLQHNADNPDWDKAPGDYRIWRYVVENTLPGDNTQQKSGLTTGIVFKGKLLAGDGLAETHEKLLQAIQGAYAATEVEGGSYVLTVDGKNYPILYLFQDRLYVGWNDEVVRAAKDAKEGAPLYTAVFSDNEAGNPNALYQALVKVSSEDPTNAAAIEAALKQFRAAAKEAGFTLYQASNDAETDQTKDGPGYYFYYYAWNRHNDNGDKGTMGPMEFGVVRNNVYKLAVTKISRLGHPRISDNDPDPVDPDNPDEDGDAYFTVAVEVLPWTVRVNDFEF